MNAPLHPNTEHDEDLVRLNWTGEAWLGVESMRSPQHDPPRDVSRGTFEGINRKPTTGGRGRYR